MGARQVSARELLPRCRRLIGADGTTHDLGASEREDIERQTCAYARNGLRLLGVARRAISEDRPLPERREDVEAELAFIGILAMVDPPRPEVPDAVARCRGAGVRIIVVTGDAGLTAAPPGTWQRGHVEPSGTSVAPCIDLTNSSGAQSAGAQPALLRRSRDPDRERSLPLGG